MIAELIDAEHLIETGDMTKQTLSLGEKSTGTRLGDPGHYDIDSSLVNADGAIETAIQTYRPVTADVDSLLRDIGRKAKKQLVNSTAQREILSVHVESAVADALADKRAALLSVAEHEHIQLDVVRPDGRRTSYGSLR
ncbi:MAG: hypothetical protein R3F43_00080 [bacterium]